MVIQVFSVSSLQKSYQGFQPFKRTDLDKEKRKYYLCRY